MNTRRRLFASFMRNPRGLVVFAFSILLIVGLVVERVESGPPPAGTLSAGQWTPLGPGIINGPFAGRIDVAAPDPTNPNVMYLGSNNGGIWKTTNWLDASPTWTVITDQPQILSLAIHEHDLVVFPGNSNIVLAAASGPGGGILRSEDAGNTWSFLANSKFDLAEFGALVVDPNVANAQTLYVAVSGGSANFLFGSGLYKSVDGGATWTDTGSRSGVVFSGFVNDLMQIQENGKTVLYAADAANGPASSGGIFRSVDGGLSWPTTNFPTNANGYADIRLAGGTTPTELIYASAIDWTSPARNNARAVTRYSWDTVGSWSTLTWPDASSGAFQHRVHHNVLAVDPANSKNVFVNTDVETNLLTLNPDGTEKYGEFIWESPDGGKTWNAAATAGGDPVSGSFDSTGKFISTGDAGIFRDPVNDGTSSAVKGSNLNTIEFYSFSLDPSNPRTAYGLFQDGPGTIKYLGDLNWLYKQPLSCGQGESGKIRVDPTNPNRVYYLDPNPGEPVSAPGPCARFVHSDDGGLTWTPAISGLPTVTVNQNGVKVAVTDFASFPGKGSIVIDPNNPKRLLLALAKYTDANNVTTPGSVFETTTGGDPNLTDDPNFNGNGWRDLGQNMGNDGETISKIALAPSDPNTIFAGTEDGRIFKTTTAGAQSPSWIPVDSGLPIFQDMRIMDLQINPANPDYDFAVISHFMGRDDKPNFNDFSHVWVRNGGGWSPINGNLPTDLGGETLAVDWQATPVLYLGTLRGAFKSTDLGTTWTRLDSMPRTRVSDLDFMPNLHLLAAGTIGRGAWEILTQSTPPTVTPPANQTSVEAASQSFSLGSFSDPDGGPWTVDVDWGDGSPHTDFSAASPGSLAASNHTYQEQGPYTVTIAVTDTLDGQSDSKTFTVNVSDPAVNASGGFTFQAKVGTSTGPQAVATFTDPAGAEPNASDSAPPNSGGHYTANIDWGDGAKSAGVITPLTPSTPSQQFTVTGNHTYAMESPVSGFNVITTINHEGVTSTATSNAIVGRAGLVAGSGNIGASRSFSFVAQPDSNSSSFKGNLNYQDTINNINVQSTSVTFVSILSDNVHATFSGTAMVNGTSGYTFRVDVEDNGQPGIGVDRFRIRLSGPASYDSNTFAANAGLLTGGHIQLH